MKIVFLLFSNWTYFTKKSLNFFIPQLIYLLQFWSNSQQSFDHSAIDDTHKRGREHNYIHEVKTYKHIDW